MFIRIRNSKLTKILSVWILLNLFLEFLSPLRLLALTGGPSQPEMAGFTPADTDNMVDLFSGNFHYTIPLLVVPGPNGGYPVNLNYNSAIGMEHEASWVGLGWNLNPGAINRQVRGIPDDCNGDQVTKIYKRRNNNTFIFSPSGGFEAFGANFGIGANLASSLVYNTYMGISLSNHFGVSASYVKDGRVQNKRNKIVTGNLGVNFDSNNGISPSFSMSGKITKNLTIGGNFGYNSKSGTYTFGNQISLNFFKDYAVKDKDGNPASVRQGIGTRIGSSFSTASVLPPVSVPLETSTFATSFQLGGASNFVEGYGGVAANVSIQKTKSYPIQTPAYGLLYAHNATKTSLQDYNREKDIGVDQHSLNLPVPVLTHDIYSINGELLNGNFRAYRSDYGHFFDNYVENYSATLNIGADLGLGQGSQVGGTVANSESTSSNGDWSAGYDNLLIYKDKRTYGNRKAEDPQGIVPALYEPFYFKMNGEKTAMNTNYLNPLLGDEAVSFPLKKNIGSSLFGINKRIYTISRALKARGGASRDMSSFVQQERTKRTYAIEYEMRGATSGDKKKDHIHRFTVVNGNGERFTYGEPLYNLVEKEVVFSLPYQSIPAALKKSTVDTYPAVCTDPDANTNQRMGKERLYSSTTTPAYAHTYPIRHITSADYIDFTGDGPSDDDFGYWVKFDYTQNQRYRWRFPFKGAQLFIGDVSNRQDDKGSYTYGEKEISYLSKITTKTHEARFYTSVRKDAGETGNERNGGPGTVHLQKLDSIVLYSRADPAHPIKSVHFEYDYSLCHNVPNNSLPSSSRQRGKLTLKKVYFTYASSEKGKENPYTFTYFSDENYNYDPVMMDRWGNYKGNANYFEHYVTQNNKAQQDRWARAWCLSSIGLPSGGTIDVEYESGDYAYVQNKQAMYMAQLTRTSSFTGQGPHYVYFRIESGTDPKDYVSGFDHNLMAFKVAVRASSEIADPDYVQGYIRVKPETARKVAGTTTEGYVEVERFDAYNIHPIYFLCLQHLRNNRPDILFNGYDANDNQSDAKSFFNALISQGLVAQANAMYGNDNFYRYCVNKTTYFKELANNPDMPSYLRLNVPDKIKYGGGVRVKSITLSDNWDKSEPSRYRREYVYRKMENGKMISSGVAEYEPMVGGEETALRYPVYDETTGLFFIEDEIYSEVPYGESYFPGASVGYSQVIVKTYTPPNVQLSTSGIQVTRFYTAHDFPITVSQTRIQAEVDPVPGVLSILTAGFKQVSSSAYSQGYQVELNDMHGKTRSVATYPYQYTANSEELAAMIENIGPVSSVEYYYKEKKTRGVRKVDNEVSVLTDDAVTERKRLGQTYDFVVDMRESHTISKGEGVSANVMLATLALPIPGVSAMPTIDSFEETVRSVSTAKVIYSSGILEKTVAYNNGSRVTTENIHFDPYTGEPLMSTVTNEFDKPVYSYSLPAYWFYENMGSAADNYRAAYIRSWNNYNTTAYFGRYDRFVTNTGSSPLTLDAVTGSGQSINVKYWNSAGSNLSTIPSELEIVRSGRSNQLGAIAASTLSLTDPVAERRFPLFDTYNAKHNPCFQYTDCAGNINSVRIFYYTDNCYYFVKAEENNKDICNLRPGDLIQSFPYVKGYLNGMANYPVTSLNFIKKGKRVEVYQGNRLLGNFQWSDPKNLFPECQDGMLQASAMEYGAQWQYPYQDVGITSAPTAGKEEYLGIRNVHRPLRSDVFITERKQTGQAPDYRTNIAYDGTFESFSYFLHEGGNAENMQDPWKWSTEITRYSPFNFEIENRNALGIYSSALYGYKNSLATAVANNARYCEIGYDSFENDLAGTSVANQKRGHFRFNGGTVTDGGHTGKKSVRHSQLSLTVNTRADLSGAPDDGVMTLQRGKTYLFSCWISVNLIDVSADEGVPFNASVGSTAITNIETQARIDGWQKVEFEFTVPQNATNLLTIQLLRTNSGSFYFDDVRMMPSDANMRSYVYDPANYRLVAEMDENNDASFYNYDEEGIMVQIKKETEKGIMTLRTTRQNLKH